MSMRMDQILPIAEGEGLPLQYYYLVGGNGGTIKVPLAGPDGENLIVVLAFTTPNLAREYHLMWRKTAGFPAGVRVARLTGSHPEARSMPQEVIAETSSGRATCKVRLAIDARMGPDRN